MIHAVPDRCRNTAATSFRVNTDRDAVWLFRAHHLVKAANVLLEDPLVQK